MEQLDDYVEQLDKTSYGRGDYDKYYIDCAKANTQSIEVQELLKNTKRPEIAILHAIATDDIIQKKRHIVVKISDYKQHNSMAEKEFEVGHRLHELGLSGFIKFICLFQCYDDTSKQFRKTKEQEQPLSTAIHICNAKNKTDVNYKHVLVMPYIPNGSIATYGWMDNFEILKSISIHTVLTLANAFDKTGFIHNDLNWGNILFKKTTIGQITYTFSKTTLTVPTNGYKVVIADFEKVLWVKNNNYLFWTNILMFFMRTNITNPVGKFIRWQTNEIIQFIDKMIVNHKPVVNIVKLIPLIQISSFTIYNIENVPQYDPNIFG
jgi:hypothetical protein